MKRQKIKKIAHIGNLFRHRRDDVLLYCLVTNLEHDKMDNSMIPLQGIEINSFLASTTGTWTVI
jgi:hypothetical protein